MSGRWNGEEFWMHFLVLVIVPLVVAGGILLTRGRLVEVFINSGFPIPNEYSILSLAEPPPEFPIFRLGTLYRVMHDLTLPYVTGAYLLGFAACFVMLRIKRKRLGGMTLLFIEIIHLGYLALYFLGFTMLGPIHIDGTSISSEPEQKPPTASEPMEDI